MAIILIVDDIPANRKFLVTLLAHHGHRMLEAGDGSEGLASVHAEHPDLIITDVLMPVMDGYEFVRQLRLDPATARIPVVFYTAQYGEREARALALSSGVSGVLTKPAESVTVMKVVTQALSGKSGPGKLPGESSLATDFDREHLRLVTDKLSESVGDLKKANARLRALINIGLDFASMRNSGARLLRVCESVYDLFGGSYVTLGILDRRDGTVQRFVTVGADVAEWIRTGDPVPSMLAKVVRERQTLRGPNAGSDSAELLLPAGHPPIASYLAAPIASPDNIFGWICLVSIDEGIFTEEDEHLVTALTGQIGRIYEMEQESLERKQAESALRRAGEQAQKYLDTANVILLALDLEGRVTLVNRYACSILGWSAEELLGRDWADMCIPAPLRASMRLAFRNPLEGDASIVENPVVTRSGEERLIEWRSTVLRDDAGHVVGSLNSGTDITDRKRAVEAKRTSEERVGFALEAASIGIWDMNFTTGVLQWSEILETQYGLQPGTFPGTFDAFISYIHPEDRESLLETMAQANRTGADFTLTHRVVWPDGTVRWLNGRGRIQHGENNEPVRGVGISLDVTERRTLEEQYLQAQKMEAIGRLAGGVAHDFNNLLTAILGYCDLLLADVDSNDPRQADITEIQKAGLRAAGLTRQLLAFSRKQIIQPTLLDLNVIVPEMRTMLVRLIGEDVRVVVGLQPDLQAIKADRGQVEQILMNLAVNARDAMPTGGTLTIETANAELDEEYATTHLSVKPGPYVVLTVSDTGSGMAPEVQGRIFEPFFTTKEEGKGTGLGLATVHGIISQSGGSINVYSEMGKGTSFKVYFPTADPGGEVVAAAPRAKVPHAGVETILLVEDADGLRQLARRLLERLGYTVLVAANAAEALAMFEQNGSIDVILTDVVMPGASGPELIRELVDRQPALKVIYMSGYTEDAIVRHGVLDPATAFLHKPFTSEALGRKVREVLDQ